MMLDNITAWSQEGSPIWVINDPSDQLLLGERLIRSFTVDSPRFSRPAIQIDTQIAPSNRTLPKNTE